MRQLLLSTLLLFSFSSLINAQQLEALTELRYVVEGIPKYDIVDGIILVDKTAKPKLKAVGYLLIEAKGKNVAITAKDIEQNKLRTKSLSSKDGLHEFLVFGSGKISVDAFIVDWAKQSFDIQSFNLNIVDGPTPPEPVDPVDPVDPVNPTIPDDDFDNLGQRVFEWSKGLSGRKDAAKIYKDAAMLLKEDPSKTIDNVSLYLITTLKEKVDYDSYADFRKNVNADLQQRWSISPLPRGVLADYYMAIHNGLNN